jgi:hypothetical protein
LGTQLGLSLLSKVSRSTVAASVRFSVMSGSSLPLVAAAIAVACAIIIASNGGAVNEKLAELFCKKGETMDCMFFMSLSSAH